MTKLCPSCGRQNLQSATFCAGCGTSFQNIIKPSSTPPPPPKNYSSGPSFNQPIKQKQPGKGLIALGCFLITITLLAYVFPINDLGWSLATANEQCKGPLGLIGMAFGGQKVVEVCSSINGMMIFVNFLGLLGIIVIIIGFTKKK